jgi:CubicO group peptidase (beta-lactamase class C family)
MQNNKVGADKFAILFIFALLLYGNVFSQHNPKNIVTLSGKKVEIKELNFLVQRAMDSLKIAGASMAIINDGKIVYHDYFGVTNFDTKRPVNDSTLFEGASLSKPLFAYFFLKMVEKGDISLDTPLYKYLPHPAIKDNDKRYELITARMVLSHQTGFPNWSVDKPIEMAFLPGTGFSYSGEAHQWLTASLATKLNTNWQGGLDSIFQTEVAKPLGMQHSYYVRNEFTLRNKATGYYKDGKAKTEWTSGSKSFGAAHTLHSESKDFANFLMAIINETGLKKATYDEMLMEHVRFAEDNELLKYGQTGWALGFAMKPTPFGIRYQHTGNNSGFQSFCYFYKEKKTGFVLFTNSEKALELYEKIGQLLDDGF